jgi:ubiquinone/menaquinone biosynthesis C-methylase UbiE
VIEFKKLNIEEDPSEQGFESNSYDLVIASQVLHATKNINRTLANVRKLLRRGGKLLLCCGVLTAMMQATALLIMGMGRCM